VTAPVSEDLDDQRERTLLSWRRTALALLGTGLLVGHLAAARAGVAAPAVTLVGSGAVVGFVWLGRAHQTAVTGLALVLGVLLLGAVALAGVVSA
jgi:uncharacterized membrane protein YidH (DUF202 family)